MTNATILILIPPIFCWKTIISTKVSCQAHHITNSSFTRKCEHDIGTIECLLKEKYLTWTDKIGWLIWPRSDITKSTNKTILKLRILGKKHNLVISSFNSETKRLCMLLHFCDDLSSWILGREVYLLFNTLHNTHQNHSCLRPKRLSSLKYSRKKEQLYVGMVQVIFLNRLGCIS